MNNYTDQILGIIAKPAKSLDDSFGRDQRISAVIAAAKATTAAKPATASTTAAKPADTGPGVMTRAAFDALTPSAKMAFCKAGGKLTD